MAINWWTIAIQTVNVVVLVWLLQHFFWRPVAAMIELRRTTAAKTVADAETSRREAAAALTDIAKTRAGFAVEKAKILGDAQLAAQAARVVVLGDASRAAAALVATSSTDIAKAAVDAENAWADRSSQLAVAIAGRLANRLGGVSTQSAFLDWLLASIAAMPELERRAVATGGASLEARSASALDPAQQAHICALIGKALGTVPQMTFTVDPAMIAGLELHGAHFTVGNSWRSDLATILADLKHAA